MTRIPTRLSLFLLFRAAPAGLLGATILLAACGGETPPEAGAAGDPGAGMMATPVTIVTVTEAPVARTTAFVASVRSRGSTTIQPQAEGFLTAIRVQSGASVSPGDVLFEIDARTQQAAVASLQSVLAARGAEAALASQQLERVRTLLDVGAVSQQELDQAEAAQKAADAQVQAIEEQIRQQQTELAYYQVVAPTAGIVGDVPVRVGDLVTRGTVLTTVADNRALELYLNVPVHEAARLQRGLPVRVLDAEGAPLTTTNVSFVSPTVDTSTQTVLVKAPVSAGPTGLRADQFVRVEVVWSTEPGISVPVVAVSRVNGQYFVYSAEPADGGGLVAAQRSITVGPVVGDAYVVETGLSAGDRLIVAGTQKIGDGAPVQPLPGGGAPPDGAGSGTPAPGEAE